MTKLAKTSTVLPNSAKKTPTATKNTAVHTMPSSSSAGRSSASVKTDTVQKSSTPLVSIVIPVYDTGASAAKLIKTLLSSPYQNLEILAVDDGSTDNSLNYLRAIQDPQKSSQNSRFLRLSQDLKSSPAPDPQVSSKSRSKTSRVLNKSKNPAITPSRLRILSQKNSGPSAARNLGIKHAHGKYIAFFDSDDSVDPSIITEFVKSLEPHTRSMETPNSESASETTAPPSTAVATSNSSAYYNSAPEPLLALCAYRYHRVRQGTTTDIYTTPLAQPHPGDTFPAYILRLLLTDGRLYAVINKLFRTEIIKKHHLAFDTSLDFAEDTKFVLEYLKYAYHDIILSKNSQVPTKSSENLEKYSFGDIKLTESTALSLENSDDYSSHDISATEPLASTLIANIPEPLYHYNYGTVTSTASRSSLPWENWQASLVNLEVWLRTDAAGCPRTPTARELGLLKKVRARWRISHALAVARANLSLREKRQYLSYAGLFVARLMLLFRR